MWPLIVVVSVTACGRLGFGAQPGDGGGGSATGDARTDAPIDAPPIPCSVDGDCGLCQRCGDNNFCANEPINQVFLGHQSTCFLGAGGSRWCAGQYVGLPGDVSPLDPQRIPGEDGWTALYLGDGTSFGTRNTEIDEFGHGYTPELFTNDLAWAQISIQLNDYCYRRADGTLTCDGVAVTGTWATVATGYQYYCGVQTDGSLWCWGLDSSNELGHGVEADGTVLPNPTRVGVATDWMDVGVGADLSCARKLDDTIWCWGSQGDTGTNGVNTNGVPAQISPDTDWSWVEVRWAHACAGKPDGRVFCWGTDGYGLDVVPGNPMVLVPTQITAETFDQFLMGGHHYCAQRAGVWTCWGWNMNSQLGTGDAVDRASPDTPLCGRGM